MSIFTENERKLLEKLDENIFVESTEKERETSLKKAVDVLKSLGFEPKISKNEMKKWISTNNSGMFGESLCISLGQLKGLPDVCTKVNKEIKPKAQVSPDNYGTIFISMKESCFTESYIGNFFVNKILLHRLSKNPELNRKSIIKFIKQLKIKYEDSLKTEEVQNLMKKRDVGDYSVPEASLKFDDGMEITFNFCYDKKSLTPGAAFKSPEGKYYVLLYPLFFESELENQIFTVMHEVGHIRLGHCEHKNQPFNPSSREDAMIKGNAVYSEKNADLYAALNGAKIYTILQDSLGSDYSRKYDYRPTNAELSQRYTYVFKNLKKLGNYNESVSYQDEYYTESTDEIVPDDSKIEKVYFKNNGEHANAYVKAKGIDKPLRGRSEVLIINGDKVYLCFKDNGEYRLPGGGWDENEPHEKSAIREAKEEAKINCTDIKYISSRISVNDNAIEKCKKENVPEEDWWYGWYTKLYVADYSKKFTGYVNKEDRDDNMVKNGKWYDIIEVWDKLYPDHKDALKSQMVMTILRDHGLELVDDDRDNIKVVKESCESDLTKFTWYHAEIARKGFNPKLAGGWDEELYSKSIEMCIHNDIESNYHFKDLDKTEAHLYTAGEELRPIYLGIITIWRTEKGLNWEWSEQQPIPKSMVSYIKEEIHPNLLKESVMTEGVIKSLLNSDKKIREDNKKKIKLDFPESKYKNGWYILNNDIFLPSLTASCINDIITDGFIDRYTEKDLSFNPNDDLPSRYIESLSIIGKNEILKYIESDNGDSGDNYYSDWENNKNHYVMILHNDSDGDIVYCKETKKTYVTFAKYDEKPIEISLDKLISDSNNCVSDFKKIVSDNNYFKESVMTEGVVLNDKDIYYNKAKFESGETNLCFITGHSGSGKSTMAHGMEKVEVYELDDVIWNKERYTIPEFKEYGDCIYSFFNGSGKKYYYTAEEVREGKHEKFNGNYEESLIKDFVNHAISYAKSHKNINVVIEGVWLYMFIEPSTLKDYAVYIKGTSGILSTIRAAKREAKRDDKLKDKVKTFFGVSFANIKGDAGFDNDNLIGVEGKIKKYRDYFSSLQKKQEKSSVGVFNEMKNDFIFEAVQCFDDPTIFMESFKDSINDNEDCFIDALSTFLEATNNTHIIIEEIYPRVEEVLSTPNGDKLFKKTVEEFVNRNTDKLHEPCPISMIAFTDVDKSKFYAIFDFTEKELMKIVGKAVSAVSDTAQFRLVKQNPIFSVFYCVLRYYTLKNDNAGVNTTLIIHALASYPSVFSKYFKYGANPGVMKYTADHLTEKFIFKQEKHVFGALKKSIDSAYKFLKPYFKEGSDKEIIRYIQRIRNDQNSMIKKIANEYNKNYNAGKTVSTQSESYDTGALITDYNNDTSKVETITHKIIINLLTNGIDLRILETAGHMAQLSVSELRLYLTKILIDSRSTELEEFINAVLFIYLFDEKHEVSEIKSKMFLSYGIELFRKTNSNNKNIATIKGLLDKWAEETGIHSRYRREPTRISYKKGIYWYILLTIQTNS